MDNMIGALLDDAFVHPSHVILHSSLSFRKGQLQLVEEIILEFSLGVYLLGDAFQHANPRVQPVDLLVKIAMHRVDPQLDLVRARRVPGSKRPGAVHRVGHRARGWSRRRPARSHASSGGPSLGSGRMGWWRTGGTGAENGDGTAGGERRGGWER